MVSFTTFWALCQMFLSTPRTNTFTRVKGTRGAEASTPPRLFHSSHTTDLGWWDPSWRLCHRARSGPRTNTCNRDSASNSTEGMEVREPPRLAQSLQQVPLVLANWNLCIRALSPKFLAKMCRNPSEFRIPFELLENLPPRLVQGVQLSPL